MSGSHRSTAHINGTPHCNDVFLLFNQVYQLILDHQDHLDVMVKTTAAGQEQTPSLVFFSI